MTARASPRNRKAGLRLRQIWADTTVPLAAAEATHAEFVAKHDPAALIEIPGAAHTPWDAMEQRSDDFFGFLTTYARLGELQCPEKV